jgi:hypothetical protein
MPVPVPAKAAWRKWKSKPTRDDSRARL